MINKDTNIYGSFSMKAGNNGCKVFNFCFQWYKLNSIYKSFSVSNIEDAINAAKILKFKGFAISAPFKIKALNYIDFIDNNAKKIGAINTVLNINGKLKGYNTDYLAIKEVLENTYAKKIIILGNGGFSLASQYACKKLKIDFDIITKDNWGKIKNLENCVTLNCTPVKNIKLNKNVTFIDGDPETETGKNIAKIQAKYQFELYTKLHFPEEYE